MGTDLAAVLAWRAWLINVATEAAYVIADVARPPASFLASLVCFGAIPDFALAGSTGTRTNMTTGKDLLATGGT